MHATSATGLGTPRTATAAFRKGRRRRGIARRQNRCLATGGDSRSCSQSCRCCGVSDDGPITSVVRCRQAPGRPRSSSFPNPQVRDAKTPAQKSSSVSAPCHLVVPNRTRVTRSTVSLRPLGCCPGDLPSEDGHPALPRDRRKLPDARTPLGMLVGKVGWTHLLSACRSASFTKDGNASGMAPGRAKSPVVVQRARIRSVIRGPMALSGLGADGSNWVTWHNETC
jgi:hypothetical protein